MDCHSIDQNRRRSIDGRAPASRRHGHDSGGMAEHVSTRRRGVLTTMDIRELADGAGRPPTTEPVPLVEPTWLIVPGGWAAGGPFGTAWWWGLHWQGPV